MSRGYEAHESFWADVKMYMALLIRAILVGLLSQALVFFYGFSTINFSNIYVRGHDVKIPGSAAIKYHLGLGTLIGNFGVIEEPLRPFVQPWAGDHFTKLDLENYCRFLDYLTGGQYRENDRLLHEWLRFSFVGYLFSPLYVLLFFAISKSKADKKFIRGAQLLPIKKFNKILAQASQNSPVQNLKFGDTIWPFEMEAAHLLILGTSGSGKSVLLNQLTAQINARKETGTGEKIIFYDQKGEFIAKQFQPGDYIFSPYDKRCLRWSLFNEIEIPPDFDVIAKSLYTSQDPKNDYWFNSAADVFRTGLVWLHRNRKTTNRDILNFFSQPLDRIKEAFKELPIEEQGALKHVDKSDSNASASIISILLERIVFLRAMVDLDGDFSFRRYIRRQGRKRQPNLFILNVDQYEKNFKPLMTLAIDVMIREALSLPDSTNRRLWFVIDELGTLYKMDSVIKLERVGRSKGAALICGNQDLGKVEEQYGRAELKSFFNNFNTTFSFCVRDPETSEFLSKAIGEEQIIKTTHSRQMSPSDVGDRKSEAEQEKTERLLLPTEFQSLPKFHAIINMTGYGVSKIIIPHGEQDFFPNRYPHFVLREFAAEDHPEALSATAEQTSQSKALTAEADTGVGLKF